MLAILQAGIYGMNMDLLSFSVVFLGGTQYLAQWGEGSGMQTPG